MPDMINYEYNQDVYTIWADMLIYDKTFVTPKQEYTVGYIGRRDGIWYENNYDQIRETYKNEIVLETDVPEALSAAMGNHVFIVRTTSQEKLFEIIRYALRREDGSEWM